LEIERKETLCESRLQQIKEMERERKALEGGKKLLEDEKTTLINTND
jgi:hypothetical protein